MRYAKAVKSCIVAVVKATAVLYVASTALLYGCQSKLVFPAPEEPLADPTRVGYPMFQTEHLVTADGLRLEFWAATPKRGMPTIIDFHGNGANASYGARYLAPFARAGYGVVLAEYRGYSGNPGKPSEAGLAEDARAYARWVSEHWAADRPVLLGESIGSGVAVTLASEHPTMGVILDSPFTSLTDVVAAGPYFWAPTILLRSRFDNLSRIPRVTSPLLVIHGGADTLIPEEQARKLLAAAPCPWGGLFLPGIPHLTLGNDTSGQAEAEIARFLGSLRAGGACVAPTRPAAVNAPSP